MQIQLRDYQRRAIDDTKAHLTSNPVLVAPTGSGKTVMGAKLVQELGCRTLWLAHRRELIEQAATRLESFGLWCGRIQAGAPTMPMATVQVASVQTLARREVPDVDLVVIDEAHHAKAATYAKPIECGAPVVGLTATPFRLDGRSLGDIFGHIAVAAYPDELCATGTLVEPIVYAPSQPDLSGVRMRMGEYSTKESFRAMSDSKITGDIVATWRRRALWRRTVVFAVNVEHSRAIVQAFRANGVPAEHIDGKLPPWERAKILKQLENGEIFVVSNCAVLTEGWDLPILEVAIIARPTASLCMHLQTIGRVMRSAPEKDGAIVLDHAGNHHRHGLVTQRIEYTLDTEDEKTPKDACAAPVKSCPSCFVVVVAGIQTCPECGHEFRGKMPREVAGELELVQQRRLDASTFEQRRDFWSRLEHRRLENDYKPGWSLHQFRNCFGVWPDVVELHGRRVLIDPVTASKDEREAVHRRFLNIAKEKGYKPGWAAHQYRRIFGDFPQRRSA